MSLLAWGVARRNDRDALRMFECTEPERAARKPWGGWSRTHPARHELVVQALIRTRLAPVGDPARTVLLGWDSEQRLGAVSTYRHLGDGSFIIDAIAVARRFRSKGGAWAREALSTTLDFITADADGNGHAAVTVAALIHEDNRPSRRLFEAQRFEQTGIKPDGYQAWSAEFPIRGIDQ